MKEKIYINIKNINCYRNNLNVFRNISFTVRSKDFVIIRGKNGSGKTSLLLGLAGILCFDGDIKWKKGLNKIGYVGHKNALKENERVNDYIDFWLDFYQSSCKKEDIIKQYSLKNILDYQTNLLSFGQKKLLSFLRLHMLKSLVWLLDEPLSGLDKKNKGLILERIEKHNNSGGATVMTTHDESYLDYKGLLKEIKIV